MSRVVQKKTTVQLRKKALQPEERFCRILKKPVTVLVEYSDYRGPRQTGAEGAIYCSNIIECYQNNVPCRYSGISPLYPDPFEGVPRDMREARRLFGCDDTEVEVPVDDISVEDPSTEEALHEEPRASGVELDRRDLVEHREV